MQKKQKKTGNQTVAFVVECVRNRGVKYCALFMSTPAVHTYIGGKKVQHAYRARSIFLLFKSSNRRDFL